MILLKLNADGWPETLVSQHHEGAAPAGHLSFSSFGELDAWKKQNEALRPENRRPASPAPVPPEVPLWKLREVLAIKGLLSQVEAVIAAIPDANKRAVAKNRFEYKETIERNHPLTVQLVAAIGLTSQQADEIFQAAEAL